MIDLIGAIPIYEIILLFSNSNEKHSISELPKFLRILKATKIFKIFKEKRKIFIIFTDFFGIKKSFDRFIYISVVLLSICHLSACLW